MIRFLLSGAAGLVAGEALARGAKRLHALDLKQKLKDARKDLRYRRLANRYYKLATRSEACTRAADEAEAELLEFMIHNGEA